MRIFTPPAQGIKLPLLWRVSWDCYCMAVDIKGTIQKIILISFISLH